MAGLFADAGNAVTVAVRLSPKASANRILGIEADPDGNLVLKVQVTAVPEDGKANAALVKLLAKAWRLPKTSLSIASGASSRRKVVRIAGDPRGLLEHLREWERSVT